MGIVNRLWETKRQGGASASGDVKASGECTRGDGEQRQAKYVGGGAGERRKPAQSAGGLELEVQPVGRFTREPVCRRERAALARTSSRGPLR